MISRDQVLVNLYTIRAGLSLISRNKEEYVKFEPIPHCLQERIRLEKAFDGIYVTYVAHSSVYSKRIKSELDMESRRVTAALVGHDLSTYAEYEQIIQGAIKIIKEYKLHKKEFKNKKEYLDHSYEIAGVYRLFDYLIDNLPSDYLTGGSSYEIARDTQRKLALKGKIKFFEHCDFQLAQIRKKLYVEERYNVYCDYILQIEKERKEIRADGRQKYVESLIDQYGSLEKALQGIVRNMDNKVKEALAVYDAMYRCYNDFLPVTQWKNVDALIYYISEGYADTVKEALNLMLQQKQNDRIVDAISKMEKTISTTVSRGMSMLESRISTGFASLSDQLDAVYRQQSLANTQLARANHAIDLSNVLSMKANMTSRQMADDISYFRSLVN